MENNSKNHLDYLAELYPTIGAASTEIINLQAVLNLPKGTEHFMSDLHGEYEAFSHVLRNGSGAVRKKIDDVFGHTLNTPEKRVLATLIYYPEEKIEQVTQVEEDLEDWYRVTLYRLIEICKTVASKYTREKVRKALPKEYAYVIEELITEKSEVLDKGAYYESIVQTIVELGSADKFIIELAELIKRLAVDHLHIIGDIFDRGPSPHLILDDLMNYHSLDIQWGNHDILWMGAAAGNEACIATVVRLCLRYDNLDVLEEAYGINMLPLATFSMEHYTDEQIGNCFKIHSGSKIKDMPDALAERMHKAITIMQLKLEGQLIQQHPEFGMDNRLLLDKINFENGTVQVEGRDYQMLDTAFPTIDPQNPYELTEGEKDVISKFVKAFRNSDKLQKHVQFLIKQGSLYKIYNSNLLYHGCMPLETDGTFKEVCVADGIYKGRELYEVLEMYVRRAFFSLDAKERKFGRHMMWFLWSAPGSPLFGRNKMATFERYFIEDKDVQKEIKNPYYQLIEEQSGAAEIILNEFNLSGEKSHIINGHVPIHQKEGESPVKCDGKVLIIDGGFSEVYHKETGIAGYTLTYNSYGLTLTSHEPFESRELAISNETDIVSRRVVVQQYDRRQLVGDTFAGKYMKERIAELKELIKAYRTGQIKENYESAYGKNY